MKRYTPLVYIYILIFIFFGLALRLDGLEKSSWYDMVNSARREAGLTYLKVDSSIETLAYAYSLICYEERAISHSYLRGEEFFDLVTIIGTTGYSWYGEVLQKGEIVYLDAEYSVGAFLASPSHRDILMDPEGDAIGMAYLWDPVEDTYYMSAYVVREE